MSQTKQEEFEQEKAELLEFFRTSTKLNEVQSILGMKAVNTLQIDSVAEIYAMKALAKHVATTAFKAYAHNFMDYQVNALPSRFEQFEDPKCIFTEFENIEKNYKGSDKQEFGAFFTKNLNKAKAKLEKLGPGGSTEEQRIEIMQKREAKGLRLGLKHKLIPEIRALEKNIHKGTSQEGGIPREDAELIARLQERAKIIQNNTANNNDVMTDAKKWNPANANANAEAKAKAKAKANNHCTPAKGKERFDIDGKGAPPSPPSI